MITWIICFAIFGWILFERCLPAIWRAWKARDYVKTALFVFLTFVVLFIFSMVNLWLRP